MPAVSTSQAAEKLASSVERAKATVLAEIYSEFFPEKPLPATLAAADLARQVRSGLKPELLVALWNVVFPADRNVWYNEIDDTIHYNEQLVAEVD